MKFWRLRGHQQIRQRISRRLKEKQAYPVSFSGVAAAVLLTLVSLAAYWFLFQNPTFDRVKAAIGKPKLLCCLREPT